MVTAVEKRQTLLFSAAKQLGGRLHGQRTAHFMHRRAVPALKTVYRFSSTLIIDPSVRPQRSFGVSEIAFYIDGNGYIWYYDTDFPDIYDGASGTE